MLGSAAAVVLLCAITNGLSLRGLGQESMLIVNGVVLAALVLAEAFATNRAELLKGQRKEPTCRRGKANPHPDQR